MRPASRAISCSTSAGPRATPAPRLGRRAGRGLAGRLRLGGLAALADGAQRRATGRALRRDPRRRAVRRARFVAVVLVVRAEAVGPLLRPAALGRRPAAGAPLLPRAVGRAPALAARSPACAALARRRSRRPPVAAPPSDDPLPDRLPLSPAVARAEATRSLLVPDDRRGRAAVRCVFARRGPRSGPSASPLPFAGPGPRRAESAGLRAGGRPLPLGRSRAASVVGHGPRISIGERGVIVPIPEKQAPPPRQSLARRGLLVENPAVTYSPGGSPLKYHRRWRSSLPCSEWERVFPRRNGHRKPIQFLGVLWLPKELQSEHEHAEERSQALGRLVPVG